jgi:hypothetical protein
MGISSERVVARFVVAKAVSLVPEFRDALRAYQQGDEEPIKHFLQQVSEIILPGGGNVPPSWFNALGTAKRNAIKGLYKDGQALLGMLSPSQPVHDADKWRSYTVMRLEEWGKKLRTLEIASQAEEENRAIERGGFTIVPMPGVKKAEIEASLEALDAAAEKIRSKFPKVLYGKVFFSTHLAAKTAAHYVYADDTIHLSVRARKRFSDIYTLIHEIGHRYDHKFLGTTDRKEFWALSTRKEYEKIVFDEKLRTEVADEAVGLAKAKAQGKSLTSPSPELVAWLKSPDGPNDPRGLTTKFLNYVITEKQLHEAIKGTKDAVVLTDKLLHGPLAVTPYGATKPTENFAEAFAHYVLGMPMAQEFEDIFARLS